MVILGGGADLMSEVPRYGRQFHYFFISEAPLFLMSEVPLYGRQCTFHSHAQLGHSNGSCPYADLVQVLGLWLQGYLAHKKQPPRGTLQ